MINNKLKWRFLFWLRKYKELWILHVSKQIVTASYKQSEITERVYCVCVHG